MLCVIMRGRVTTMSIKTYSEVIALPTFEDRFNYLQLKGRVGQETFGYDRYLNQILYNSYEWRKFRREIIVRDNGCDLACEGHDINDKALIHHINPIRVEDIINRNPIVFDPENVITTILSTHNAIHYCDENLLIISPIERRQNDTCPWKH